MVVVIVIVVNMMIMIVVIMVMLILVEVIGCPYLAWLCSYWWRSSAVPTWHKVL